MVQMTLHADKVMEKGECSCIAVGSTDLSNYYGNQCGSGAISRFSYTMSGIYPENTSSYYRGTCSIMFIASLFIIARKWKQPKWPSTGKWI